MSSLHLITQVKTCLPIPGESLRIQLPVHLPTSVMVALGEGSQHRKAGEGLQLHFKSGAHYSLMMPGLRSPRENRCWESCAESSFLDSSSD